jgi:uncharacterized membrane protein HdeD (DUF308 family)
MDSNDRMTTESVALEMAGAWTTLLFVGMLTAVIGVVVLAWPEQTLTVLSILFGIQLLVFGLFRLISAFSSTAISPGLVGFIGILVMLAGVVVLRHPFETVAVLATVLGAIWIVSGSVDVISSIADSRLDHRGFLAISGVLAILAGIVVVSWPAPSVTVIAWVAGIFLVVQGIIISAMAFRLKGAVT